MIPLHLSDFDCHLEQYLTERHDLFNHQLSGVQANRRDLSLFSRFLHDNQYHFVTGDALGDLEWFLLIQLSALSVQALHVDFSVFKATSYPNSAHYDIADAAYQTGFSSPSYFAACFKKQFGCPPSEY